MFIDEEAKGASSIAISGHVRPDGDCVGSCLGMALYLKKLLPGAVIDVFLGDFSETLRRNMLGVELIRPDFKPTVSQYDLFVCLDCEKERLGEAEPIFNAAKKTINIDHHISNHGSAMVNDVVPTASSASEVAYDTMDPEKVDAAIAQDLYIGMVTDTGLFHFSNTSRHSMEIAGRLIDFGFDFPKIVQEVWFQNNYVQQQILGRALLESVLMLQGKLIFSVVTLKELQFYKASSKDCEGIVSELADTEGVEAALFLLEMRPGTWKVSLRSNGKVNVASIAESFGGGGHVRASGCTTDGRYRDIVSRIAGLVEEQLEGAHA